MARAFKNMKKVNMISHALEKHNLVIPEDSKYRQILIQVLKLRPNNDDNNVQQNVTDNLTKFEDSLHVWSKRESVLEDYLINLGPYDPSTQSNISKWLTVNGTQLFPGHCFSYGPNEDRTEYWITIAGDEANVQWILTPLSESKSIYDEAMPPLSEYDELPPISEYDEAMPPLSESIYDELPPISEYDELPPISESKSEYDEAMPPISEYDDEEANVQLVPPLSESK